MASSIKESYIEPTLTLKTTAQNINACAVFKIGNVDDIGNKTIYIRGRKTDGKYYKILLGYSDSDGNNRQIIVSTEESRLSADFYLNMQVDKTTYEGKIVIVWFYLDRSNAVSVGDISTFSDVIVSVGSSRDYVPYQTPQTVLFPLSSGQYMAQGDYPGNDSKIHHKWGQDIFDGSIDEEWAKNNETETYVAFVITKLDSKYYASNNDGTTVDVLCDKFIGVPAIDRNTANCISLISSNRLYLVIGKEYNITTVEQLRTFLATSPITVQYRLENEMLENFTQAQQTAWNSIKKLMSYKGVTRISQENDNLSFYLKVVYRVDPSISEANTKSEIESIKARLELLES